MNQGISIDTSEVKPVQESRHRAGRVSSPHLGRGLGTTDLLRVHPSRQRDCLSCVWMRSWGHADSLQFRKEFCDFRFVTSDSFRISRARAALRNETWAVATSGRRGPGWWHHVGVLWPSPQTQQLPKACWSARPGPGLPCRSRVPEGHTGQRTHQNKGTGVWRAQPPPPEPHAWGPPTGSLTALPCTHACLIRVLMSTPTSRRGPTRPDATSPTLTWSSGSHPNFHRPPGTCCLHTSYEHPELCASLSARGWRRLRTLDSSWLPLRFLALPGDCALRAVWAAPHGTPPRGHLAALAQGPCTSLGHPGPPCFLAPVHH